MKRLIATAVVLFIVFASMYAGGGVQYLQEHHEAQKIIVMHVNTTKVENISVPEGWHVADIAMVSHGHSYATIVIVLERNH